MGATSRKRSAASARKIEDAAAAAGKPVVIHFLGGTPEGTHAGIVGARSLREAADFAFALARGEQARAGSDALDAKAAAAVDACIAKMAPTQTAVRGLFTGGTFCYEAQLAFLDRGLACSSNAPAHGAEHYDGKQGGHVFLDLGDDDYTRGRPHPMIDPSERNAMVRTHAANPQTAAIVFDVVLGYGAHADPAAGLAEALAEARRSAAVAGRTLALIGHVCGTDGDPQGKAGQVQQLERAGALIVGSNIEAAALAAHLAQQLAAKRGAR